MMKIQGHDTRRPGVIRRTRCWAKRLVKIKLVVIVVVLSGKAMVHWELIDGAPAKAVSFGADSLHMVFAGIAGLFV
jgi:hypothetical protein